MRNSFFLKKEKPIPDTLEFKDKYIKRKRGYRCNFIKNKEYKYILDKNMPPYTNLIFDNQLQKLHLPPKNYNEKCNNNGI